MKIMNIFNWIYLLDTVEALFYFSKTNPFKTYQKFKFFSFMDIKLLNKNLHRKQTHNPKKKKKYHYFSNESKAVSK